MDMTIEALHTTESRPKPLGTVRIECPYPVLTFALKELLRGEALVYEGRKPHGAQDPSCVILASKGRDLTSEVRRIRTFIPDAAIVLFSVHMEDARVAKSALRAGASGFIHAGMTPEQIVRALRLACAGEIVVSETTLTKESLEKLVAEKKNSVELGALTPRQREILELVSKGLSNAQIAERLFLTESTIKQHLYAAYKLLNVRNRIQAATLLQDA